MPVNLEQPIQMLSEQEFHELDFQVMKWVFDAHNTLGRFYDEKIYRNALKDICRKHGLQAESEVKIRLTHKSFSKNLFIDLLLENGAIYEFKTARQIIPEHRIQTVDYLLLTDLRHGKLINFRPPSVKHEFVSTSLSTADRKQISVFTNEWNGSSETAVKLEQITRDLFSDWGAFLDTHLYQEAIAHFFGGLKKIRRPVDVRNNGTKLGTQNVPLLSPTETFCISSLKSGLSTYQNHLQRFLNCTNLKSLYWLNLNHSEIHLQSLHS